MTHPKSFNATKYYGRLCIASSELRESGAKQRGAWPTCKKADDAHASTSTRLRFDESIR